MDTIQLTFLIMNGEHTCGPGLDPVEGEGGGGSDPLTHFENGAKFLWFSVYLKSECGTGNFSHASSSALYTAYDPPVPLSSVSVGSEAAVLTGMHTK